MELVSIAARIVLAAVFVLAGATKFADPAGTRKAVSGFGVPEWLAGPLGRLLPVVEIAIALALIPVRTAWWGAAAALLLLLVFSTAIGVNLARGQAPDCHCFGQLHSKPVSWSLVARNLALALMAGFIVTRGPDQPGLLADVWLTDLNGGHIVNLAVSAFAAALMVVATLYLRKLLNQQTTIMTRLDSIEKLLEEYAPPPVEREEMVPPHEGRPVGAPAPEFSLASIAGEQVSLEALLAFGKPVLLLFVSPNCSPCETVLAAIKGWDRDYGDKLTIAVLSKGSVKESRDRLSKYGPRHLLLVGESEVAEDYQSKWTPAAILISRIGRIASQNVYGDEDIRSLVTRAIAGSEVGSEGNGAAGNGHRSRIPVGNSNLYLGDPVPAFSAVDLRGSVVGAQDLLGTDTLLVFWDPTCPFCQAMSDDLGQFEASPPKGAPRLLFIVAGELEKVRSASENYKSLFLHDQEFEVGLLFGTRATPSAVLIDREGRIASSVATGSTNVLALAGARKMEAPTQSGA